MAVTRSNWQPWNGSTGTTTAGRTPPQPTYHQPTSKPSTMPTRPASPRRLPNRSSRYQTRCGSVSAADELAGAVVRQPDLAGRVVGSKIWPRIRDGLLALDLVFNLSANVVAINAAVADNQP